MKADDAVNQLGDIAGETLRRAFDRFLEGHPDLVATPIRVQFEGPYMATEVIEMGGEVFENATRLRDCVSGRSSRRSAGHTSKGSVPGRRAVAGQTRRVRPDRRIGR